MRDLPSGAALSIRVAQDAPIPLDARIECAAGELLALVGPSGSGKTTILRCIAGLVHPSDGRIVCGGETWLDTSRNLYLPPQRRTVGIVFQDYALFPHMTAIENVMAAMSHVPAAMRVKRAQELLALVHLSGLEDRRPAQLSGGQQQRVALARALARDPNVLLLDEPFSAVDQVTRRRLQCELAQLRRAIRVPIILVTHDLEEAALLADRMCILHHGRTLQTAPPAELLARPASPLVARLLDLRNVFDGRIERHAPETGTTWITWQGHMLETPYRPELGEGRSVSWMIPAASVVLHRRDRPSRGERENPVAGTVVEMFALGETATVLIRVDGTDDAVLSLSVPTHVARRNGLDIGIPVRVSLLKDAIHLMPQS